MWGLITYGRPPLLVFIPGALISQNYVDLVLRPVVRPFLQGISGYVFQHNNARVYVARATLNTLLGLDVLA